MVFRRRPAAAVRGVAAASMVGASHPSRAICGYANGIGKLCGYGEAMTTSKVMFDPFAGEFLAGLYETYRRICGGKNSAIATEYDYCTPTRHEDVAWNTKR